VRLPQSPQTGHSHIQPTSGLFRRSILRTLPNGVAYSGLIAGIRGH